MYLLEKHSFFFIGLLGLVLVISFNSLTTDVQPASLLAGVGMLILAFSFLAYESFTSKPMTEISTVANMTAVIFFAHSVSLGDQWIMTFIMTALCLGILMKLTILNDGKITIKGFCRRFFPTSLLFATEVYKDFREHKKENTTEA